MNTAKAIAALAVACTLSGCWGLDPSISVPPPRMKPFPWPFIPTLGEHWPESPSDGVTMAWISAAEPADAVMRF